MAARIDETDHIIISDDEARGGETGHNVRYVLAYSMTGVIAAFAAVALYLGYDRVQDALASAFSRSPVEAIQSFAPYAAIVFAGAVTLGLLLGIWNMIAGRTDDGSQQFMRFRVAGQFAIICMIMAMMYVARG